MSTRIRTFEVRPQPPGERLDRALARLLPQVSRTRLKDAILGGGVRCCREDGSREVLLKPGLVLEEPCRVELDLGALEPSQRAPANAASLDVLFVDERVLVVHKPAGLVTHPSGPSAGGTLSDLANAQFGPLPSPPGLPRPGVVHRLDAGTSGVVVLARDAAALEHLQRQFRERQVEKTYVALTWGAPRFDTDWIEAPLARSARDRERVAVAEPGSGRASTTYYEVLERFRGAAHVRCFPKTGRTHQVRVHMQHIGHPLIGDPLYKPRGGPPVRFAASAPLPARQALHAQALAFRHPGSEQPMRIEAPLPADLQVLLDWLRANAT